MQTVRYSPSLPLRSQLALPACSVQGEVYPSNIMSENAKCSTPLTRSRRMLSLLPCSGQIDEHGHTS